MWRLSACCLFLALAHAAAEDIPRETLLLARARAHMSHLLTRLPNYTCLQTVERTARRPPKKRVELLDVLRMEVALVNGRELFAWPGSKKFDDRQITEMVSGGGAIGNGSFALHAKAVFQSNFPRFTFIGERVREDGQKTLRWDYVVPQNLSGFNIQTRGGAQAVVGYHGSIWIDAQSMDLARLEVYADDIPPKLEIISAMDAVEYKRVKLGEEEFLLPSLSELQMTDTGGFENRNRTTFSACRQYTGESKISFEDPAPDAKTTEAVRTLNIPGGLSFETSLETPITETSAVGDPVTVILKKAAKLGDGLVAPKGAFVHGRITHLRRVQGGQPGWTVGMRIFDMEWPGTEAKVRGRVLDSPSVFVMSQTASRRLVRAIEIAAADQSMLIVPSGHLNMQRGFLIRWQTEPVSEEDKQ